ncbi:MAG: flavohemoglobin expression-modulating QEGLA motif protein, partial [Bdellovibrionota bacterium]
MVWTTYKEKISQISQRIVDAQRPIRVLDAIKWDSKFEADLRKSGFKEIPKIGPEYYAGVPLGYDPMAKIAEFEELSREI